MDQPDVATALRLHSQAYGLLMHLADEGKRLPDRVQLRSLAAITSKHECALWLQTNLSTVPLAFRPPHDEFEWFANLFWSFFQVSFRIDTFEWDGELLDANFVVGGGRGSGQGTRQTKQAAVRRLLRDRGHNPSNDAVRRLVKSKRLEPAVSIWTYAWQLRQRARGKNKGRSLRRLWRSIPFEARTSLTADAVDAAADAIAAAIG